MTSENNILFRNWISCIAMQKTRSLQLIISWKINHASLFCSRQLHYMLWMNENFEAQNDYEELHSLHNSKTSCCRTFINLMAYTWNKLIYNNIVRIFFLPLYCSWQSTEVSRLQQWALCSNFSGLKIQVHLHPIEMKSVLNGDKMLIMIVVPKVLRELDFYV